MKFVTLTFLASYSLQCSALTECALTKCLKRLDRPLPSKDKQANFACVFGSACQDACRKCPQCKYTQDQIKHFVLSEKTDGLCPNLERCAQRCVIEELTRDPFGCVFKRNCAKYCYVESECAPCYNTVKRVFTGVCKYYKFNETFPEKCRALFDEASVSFVAQVSQIFSF